MLQSEFANLCGEKSNLFAQTNILKKQVMIAQLTELLEIRKKCKKHLSEIDQKLYELTSSREIKVWYDTLKKWKYQLEVDKKAIEKADKNENYSFVDIIVETEKFYGFQFNREKTTVAEFAGYLYGLKKHNELLKKSQTNTKNLK